MDPNAEKEAIVSRTASRRVDMPGLDMSVITATGNLNSRSLLLLPKVLGGILWTPVYAEGCTGLLGERLL